MIFAAFSTVTFYGPRVTNKKWQKTKTQFLLRNAESGIFYARLYRDGREVWKSLKTDVYSVAVAQQMFPIDTA